MPLIKGTSFGQCGQCGHSSQVEPFAKSWFLLVQEFLCAIITLWSYVVLQI
jgi:hypothetical protein